MKVPNSKLLLIILILLTNTLRAQDRETKYEEATIISKQDSTIKCLVSWNYYYDKAIEYKLKINGVEEIMPIKDIRSVSFPFRFLENISLNGKEHLMDRVINGKVKMYRYDEEFIQVKFNNNQSIGYKDEPIEYIQDNSIICIVKDGHIFEIDSKTNTEFMLSLFSDCKVVSDTINSGNYKFYKLEKIIKLYNDCFKTKVFTQEDLNNDSIYPDPYEIPKYLGGDNAYSTMLTENFNFLSFPPYKDYFIEYELLVRNDSSITIKNKIGGDVYNEENLKAIISKNIVGWIPGRDNSKQVNSIINLKIHLRLHQIFANFYSPHSTNTDYQKGKLIDGYKSGVWEYYDNPGTLAMKINYDNAVLLFLEKDTSDFVIYKEGKWTLSKLDIQPRYIGSYKEFYKLFRQTFKYPQAALKKQITGRAYLEFEIDTNGNASNINVLDGPNQDIVDEIIKSFNAIPNLWLTASIKNTIYPAKFRLPIDLKIIIENVEIPPTEITKVKISEMPLAKGMEPIIITIKGKNIKFQDVLYFEEK